MESQEVETVLFDRYRVEEILGEGGQAVVLQAFDLRLNVPRAIKVLLPTAAKRQSMRDRFETEAQLLARIEHPNVIRVYDVEATGPVPWLVMEFVQGGTLAARLARGPLPPHLLATVIGQLCAGLSAAHAIGVVHRDVKPENVLVAPTGVCKLVDFGIARIEDSGRTRAGVTMGTQGFMAPEQNQDASSVDLRADLYGVGMTAYVLLTGREPWGWIAGERDGVPEPLRPVLAKATARNRNERYETATALAAAFRDAVRELPPDPPDATLTQPYAPHRTDVAELRARLAEVRGWFVPRSLPTLPPTSLPPPTLPPSLPPAPPPRPTLQYTMSRPTRATTTEANEARPVWISEEPVVTTTGAFEISVEAPSHPAPAAPVRPAPGTTIPERLFPDWVLVLIAALVLVFGAAAGVQWRTLAQQSAIEENARSRLVSTVDEHLKILSTLSSLGSDPALLASLEADYRKAKTISAKVDAATRLVEHARSETERLTDVGSPLREPLDASLAKMSEALDAWRAAHP